MVAVLRAKERRYRHRRWTTDHPFGTLLARIAGANDLIDLEHEQPKHLPADRIIDLDAVQQNDHVSVQWTAQEVAQHDRFIVERSTDGSKFDPIGTLQARPTNGGISYHQLDDAHPETGMNYYRVIAVAHDGAYSTSHVAKIHFRRTTQALIILPNPASDRIHLLGAEATMEEVAEIRLHDGSGRMVRHRLHSKDGGPVRFPIGDLDAGYYTVVLLDGTGSPLGTGRFMKE